MIHNLFWQKWQGHGPFENLVKDTAIDSVVLAALQPIFLPGGRAEFSRRRSLPPPPVASPSPRGLADCAETHQTPLVRAWILEGEGKAWGPRQSGESEHGSELDAGRLRLPSDGRFAAGPCFLGLLCEGTVRACTLSPSPWNKIFFSFQWMKLVSIVSDQEF